MANNASGLVKWFNDSKGYGFIEPEGGGEDIFVHFSAIHMSGFKTLRQGSRVTYELVDGPKGKQAIDIQPDESDHRPRRGPFGLVQSGHHHHSGQHAAAQGDSTHGADHSGSGNTPQHA
jgi:cold shock protein